MSAYPQTSHSSIHSRNSDLARTAPDPDTPRLSRHARERCEQMGIATKRAKRVVQERRLTYAGTRGNGAVVVMSDDPDIAVVWDELRNVIVTVIPRTEDDYVRTPDGYQVTRR